MITEYQPTKPYDLSCLIRDTTRNPSTIVIAGLSGSKMIVSTNTAQLQSWGYYGRVSIKDNLTIVIDNVTFEEQGREFQCDLQESNRFDPKIETKYILALVLGK